MEGDIPIPSLQAKTLKELTFSSDIFSAEFPVLNILSGLFLFLADR